MNRIWLSLFDDDTRPLRPLSLMNNSIPLLCRNLCGLNIISLACIYEARSIDLWPVSVEPFHFILSCLHEALPLLYWIIVALLETYGAISEYQTRSFGVLGICAIYSCGHIVQRLFNTTFYAYANSDILFDRNLTDTIYELIRLKTNLTNILIVGQRRNWKIKWKQNVWNLQEIGHYAKSAKLLGTYAQDYFISTRNGYPWSTIPDFVVGRIAYDNWLVVTALKREIPLVDASGTITALHQTDSRGDREGSNAVAEGRLNVYLAGINFPYHAAHTSCAHFSTGRYNGVFVIKDSKCNGNRCSRVAIPYIKSPFHLS